MAMDLGGLQISDAVPIEDGYQTTLVDQNGQVVATVTRLNDGSAQASVRDDAGSGFDWQSVLRQVTGFLDNAAGAAKAGSTEVQRIANAVRGGLVGTRAGYAAPTNATPYLIAAGALLAVVLLYHAAPADGGHGTSRGRRR